MPEDQPAFLRVAIEEVWGRITPALCQSWILHYYKPWKGVRDKSGTLAKCIWAEGKRFSKPKMQVVAQLVGGGRM